MSKAAVKLTTPAVKRLSQEVGVQRISSEALKFLANHAEEEIENITLGAYEVKPENRKTLMMDDIKQSINIRGDTKVAFSKSYANKLGKPKSKRM